MVRYCLMMVVIVLSSVQSYPVKLNVTKELIEQLCQKPEFDAAVFITNQYMLLFQQFNAWGVDIDSDTIKDRFDIRDIFPCAPQNNTATSLQYFVWNYYEEKFPQRICFMAVKKYFLFVLFCFCFFFLVTSTTILF